MKEQLPGFLRYLEWRRKRYEAKKEFYEPPKKENPTEKAVRNLEESFRNWGLD